MEIVKDEAYKIYQELIQSLQAQVGLFLVTGKLLKTIRDKKLYKQLGQDEGFRSFNDFLLNAEIGLRRTTAYMYIKIYELYVERLGLEASELQKIPVTRLYRLVPYVEKEIKEGKEKEMRLLVQDIEHMPNFSFDEEVKARGMETKKPMVRRDAKTGKYFIEFLPDSILYIKDTVNDEYLVDNRE